jgi:lysophospholipase L1-like esterase
VHATLRYRIWITIVALISSASPASGKATPIFNPPKSYYLALGDSVAFGYQRSKVIQGLPPSGFDTGYVDVFAQQLRLIRPDLTVVNYGCPGESTVTFVEVDCIWTALGNPLHDEFSGKQLDAALAFLAQHPGQVSPITVTLWGNDVGAFVRSCEDDLDCIFEGAPAAIAAIASNLGAILGRLRAAAPSAEIIVTGAWNHRIGFFDLSDPLIKALNEAMADATASTGARFANPFPVFNPQGDLSLETATICALLLVCTEGDIHPSDAATRRLRRWCGTRRATHPITGGRDVIPMSPLGMDASSTRPEIDLCPAGRPS